MVPHPPTLDDPAEPWRTVERQARLVVGAIVLGMLVTGAVGASVPAWSSEESLRLAASAYYRGTGSSLTWDVAAVSAWYVGLLVLAPPLAAAVLGWVLSRRRLSRAVPALAALLPAPSGGARLSEAQRRARERGQQQEHAMQLRHYTEQHRARTSVWTTLGGAFAILGGTWVLCAVVLAAAGATSTVVGAFVAVYSWLLAATGYVLGIALLAGVRAIRR